MADSTFRDPKVIGDVGELEFERWARQEGMTATKVKYDEHGWDYLLELPRSHLNLNGRSLDLDPGELRCFVQIKTLTSPDSRARIAMSNWKRMVNDLSPWFVAVVVLSDNREAEQVLAGTMKRGYTVKFTGEMRA